MGSLMAGWDSPVSDSMTVISKRNRSLTKEEIEAYWRSKKKTEEEHFKAIFPSSNIPNQLLETPLENSKPDFLDIDIDTEIELENMIKKNGWWTRSNWAFLNEPPVIERPTNSYTSQFHVANLVPSEFNRDGISA